LAIFRKKSTNVRLDAVQVFVFGMFHLQKFMPKR
jgi:putative membrane protein